jgi:hypothetical protein
MIGRAARASYYIAAPLACLILFWRVPHIWFLNDDFAWLGVPLEVNRAGDLIQVLFAPKAQGTIRFLSERLFFLTFSSLFGLHVLPYRIWVLLTWFADLTLATLVGTRLTGSRVAGVIAAILWTANSIVVTPLSWTSSYNEILVAFCILMAFYARLRWLESGEKKWIAIEWIAYLAGFGALEIIVVYPVIAALHGLLVARKKFQTTLPLFVPAILFGILHLFVIPKSAGPYYSLTFDARLPGTLFRYLEWSLGPFRLADLTGHGQRFAIRTTIAVSVALGIFAVWRAYKREFAALFCVAWFLLFLAPVLPLPNHIQDYYVTVPILGFCWLAGWAAAAGIRSGWMGRIATIVMLGAFLYGSTREIGAYTRWYYNRSMRMRAVVLGTQQAARAHPGSAIILQGVDNELFQSGFQDDPFRLLGVQQIYFVPGGEKGIEARADLGGVSRFLASPRQELNLIDESKARVLSVATNDTHDITRAYQLLLRADPRATRIDFVDVGDRAYAENLGPEWYPGEQSFRWMPKRATVKLSAPAAASQRLFITGYAPAAVFASGPVTLRVTASGRQVGSVVIRKPDEQFSFDFPLPPDFIGQESMEVAVEADKVLRSPSDNRELGMVFGTFAIR